MIVVSLLQRNGYIRSEHLNRLTSKNLKDYIRKNADKRSIIMTDEFKFYKGLNKEFIDHKVANHGRKEYVRGNSHTNIAESYFHFVEKGNYLYFSSCK